MWLAVNCNVDPLGSVICYFNAHTHLAVGVIQVEFQQIWIAVCCLVSSKQYDAFCRDGILGGDC